MKLSAKEQWQEGMKKVNHFLIAICMLFSATQASASSGFASATTIMGASIPVFSLVYSASIQDYEGISQLGHSAVLSSVVTTFLKNSTNRTRPDGGDRDSFPSGHASLAFTGATYLHWRYGPRFGIPAYLGAMAIGFQRVDSDRHFTSDVVVGALIGFAAAAVHTTRYGMVYPSYSPERSTFRLNFFKEF